MDKKLCFVAIAAMLTSPVLALAATINVDISGRINAALESVDSGSATGASKFEQVTSNASNYLRFDSKKKFAGGLTAIIRIESSIKLDQGNGGLGSRNSRVGLTGGFGTVFLGIWNNPYKTVSLPVDPFAANGFGNSTIFAIMGNGTSTTSNKDIGNKSKRCWLLVRFWKRHRRF